MLYLLPGKFDMYVPSRIDNRMQSYYSWWLFPFVTEKGWLSYTKGKKSVKLCFLSKKMVRVSLEFYCLLFKVEYMHAMHLTRVDY